MHCASCQWAWGLRRRDADVCSAQFFSAKPRAGARRRRPLQEAGGKQGLPNIGCSRLRDMLATQQARCKARSGGALQDESAFDRWCSAPGIMSDLHRAFQIHPVPDVYCQELDKFNMRVLVRHGVNLQSPLVLCIAMMHPSWIFEGAKRARKHVSEDSARASRHGIGPQLFDVSPLLSEGNARLEYLGDAVIKLALSEALIHESGMRDDFRLREVSVQRAMLESNEALGLVGVKVWGLSAVMLACHREFEFVCGRLAEDERGGRQWSQACDDLLLAGDHRGKSHVTYAANCVEAVIGAVAVDSGAEAATQLVHRAVLPSVRATIASDFWKAWHGDSWDPVSELQHLSLLYWKALPEYRTLSQLEQDGQSQFHIAAFVASGQEDKMLATGVGSSLALARRNAATSALRHLRLKA